MENQDGPGPLNRDRVLSVSSMPGLLQYFFLLVHAVGARMAVEREPYPVLYCRWWWQRRRERIWFHSSCKSAKRGVEGVVRLASQQKGKGVCLDSS